MTDRHKCVKAEWGDKTVRIHGPGVDAWFTAQSQPEVDGLIDRIKNYVATNNDNFWEPRVADHAKEHGCTVSAVTDHYLGYVSYEGGMWRVDGFRHNSPIDLGGPFGSLAELREALN